MKKLDFLLHSAANHALSLQFPDGSFPSGHNGPYHDPETPVRNTAHILFLLASLYKKTGIKNYRVAGEKAASYLLSHDARPFGASFHCRDKPGKDRCNGLIGQAWVIEALVSAADAFDCQECYDLAEEVFLIHPWDKNVGIWRRLEIDGTILSYDGTFNHQLWFAGVGGLLKNTPEAQTRSLFFLEKVASAVQLYPNGVIFHSSKMGPITGYLKNGLKPFLRALSSGLRKRKQKHLWESLYLKSAGYHGFNLYAFAMLKDAFPEARIWHSKIFKKLISAHRKDSFVCDVKKSEYGYRYNVSGIEIAYAVETFFQDKKEATMWLNRQMQETFLSETHCLVKDAPDSNTAFARIYEAARFVEEYEVCSGQ